MNKSNFGQWDLRARCDIIEIVDYNVEKEEDVLPEVPCTPSLKQLYFGHHHNSDNFENTLKHAKQVKKGAIHRRFTRHLGTKFTGAPTDPLLKKVL